MFFLYNSLYYFHLQHNRSSSFLLRKEAEKKWEIKKNREKRQKKVKAIERDEIDMVIACKCHNWNRSQTQRKKRREKKT